MRRRFLQNFFRKIAFFLDINLKTNYRRKNWFITTFYDHGTRPVAFEVKNDVFQMWLILYFRIVGKWNSMFLKFCGTKSLWSIFMTGERASFSERTCFWRNTTLDATVWRETWKALIVVNNIVFVLQATQTIYFQNLEASCLQVQFSWHVKLHVFGEDRILTEYWLLKFDSVVHKNWMSNFKVFTLNV